VSRCDLIGSIYIHASMNQLHSGAVVIAFFQPMGSGVSPDQIKVQQAGWCALLCEVGNALIIWADIIRGCNSSGLFLRAWVRVVRIMGLAFHREMPTHLSVLGRFADTSL
jgi:hypothetical protein